MVSIREEPTVLWSLRGQGRDVRCLRERTRSSFELRILWGDELFLTETFQSPEKLLERAGEFRTTLEGRGWSPMPDEPPTSAPAAGIGVAPMPQVRAPSAEAALLQENGATQVRTDAAEARPDADDERPRVLVVDDERAVRSFLRSYLEAAGYVVREADDVDAALSALDADAVDAVVLDVRMPDRMGWGRTGLEVLAFMRLHAAYEALPVLILTGHAMSDEERKLVARHHADLFMKPDGHRQLLERLNELTGYTPGPVQQS